MKTHSNVSPETFVVSNGNLTINHSVTSYQKTDIMTDTSYTEYEYYAATVPVDATRSMIIEAIIGSKMTAGAEVAIINNQTTRPEDYESYQEFRTMAKSLADEWLAI